MHMASTPSGTAVAFDKTCFSEQHRLFSLLPKSVHCRGSNPTKFKIELRSNLLSNAKLSSFPDRSRGIRGKPYSYTLSRGHSVLCFSMGTQNSEASSGQQENEQAGVTGSHLSDRQVMRRSTCTYSIVYNDAKYVNERARNDIVLLSRGITTLNDRARQDVAVLGLGILKLDARAREDTLKIDHGMKRKAARLHHITTVLKHKAQSNLKRVADQHWSDGALEADLRRADFVVRRRAMEDAFMALKFVRNIHNMMASKLYQQPQKDGYLLEKDLMGFITLEKNGKGLDLLSREVSTDRISAIQEAYWSMASALSEADGIDYTDPEELELLVAALIDLDAMDGKSSVSLLAECSNSPDVSTRQALANALAAAPSMWILGNAGMGALQRLAEDNNPAIAAAASKAIDELKNQWELEEGDSLKFMMNQLSEESQNESEPEENGNSGAGL